MVELKNKDRIKIERVKMPELDPNYRITNNEEVNKGLTMEMALQEAKRCLQCKNPTCIPACPVETNIPGFIRELEQENFEGAYKVLKSNNLLPAVCGRVCPQEKQCEASCIYPLRMKKEPVAIGYLERFVADYERENLKIQVEKPAHQETSKIAVVGSGPAGLAFAGEMASAGFQVTVFEALHDLGGVLKYGIPEFRLPNDIVEYEIENLKKIGVEFRKNFVVGKTIKFEQLKEEGFDGVFVGSGAGLPRFMNIKGENSIGVLSANEYLTRVNLMQANNPNYDTPVMKGKNVAIIGGGNTAMDAVRTAKRLGAERAMIIYRRSLEEMPARQEEIHHAMEEGVEFMCLHNPVEYLADEHGVLKKVVLQKMELGEPDASGRRRPVVVEGADFEMDLDIAVVSIGVSPNPLISSSLQDIKTTDWGTLVVDESLETSVENLYAGGDIVRGGATVILAMGDGKKAAKEMIKKLKA